MIGALAVGGCLLGLAIGLALSETLDLPGWATVLVVFALQIVGGVVGLELGYGRERRR